MQHTQPPIPERLRQLLGTRRFEHITIFSGAGMSADSGIPTFRSGDNSLWGAYNPQQMATPQAWKEDKELIWAWYEYRRHFVMAAQPHPGHLAVARLQQTLGASIVTQNVDNLHERAGATDVLHLHGSLFAPRCAACHRPHAEPLPPPPLEVQQQQQQQQRLKPPTCQHCGGYIRPGVVWFGENLDDAIVNQAIEHIRHCDLLLVVGTSGVVYPAASLVSVAKRDTTIIEINPEPGDISARVAFRWRVKAAIGLPPSEIECINSRCGGCCADLP